MYILLVKENAVAAQQIIAAMKEWNQNVAFAASGREAVKMAGYHPFDLLLIDILLPDGFGYDFIPEIRFRRQDIHIITMASYNTREIERKTRKQGVDFYMAKPVDLNELKELIGHLSKRKGKSCPCSESCCNEQTSNQGEGITCKTFH